MVRVVVLAALLLAGCAASVLSTGPRTVVIRSQTGMPDAQPLAEAECNKHGRHARWAGTETIDYTFDCVL